jgi:hypothetical protein
MGLGDVYRRRFRRSPNDPQNGDVNRCTRNFTQRDGYTDSRQRDRENQYGESPPTSSAAARPGSASIS